MPDFDLGAIGGACINVFTTTAQEHEALDVARRAIGEAGWKLEAIEQIDWYTRANCDDVFREYYDQALIDGTVVVIHTYPPEDDTTRRRGASAKALD